MNPSTGPTDRKTDLQPPGRGSTPEPWETSPAWFPRPGHRIWLRRNISLFGPTIAGILHNPSIADATRLDPTTTRMVGFARDYPASDYIQVNIASRIGTDPASLDDPDDLNCPEADRAIVRACTLALASGGIVIAGWGNPKGPAHVRPALEKRIRDILAMGYPLHAFDVTKEGHPIHPLYLPSSTRAYPYTPPRQLVDAQPTYRPSMTAAC